MAGILIHVGLGLVLYRLIRKNVQGFFAFLILMLHLNYLPKWVQMPEFELMHYWCLLGIFLLLYTCFTGGKAKAVRRILLFGAGCLLTIAMMCYPTMVLLYPLYVSGIYKSEKRSAGFAGKDGQRSAKPWESCCAFTLGAFVTGAGLLAYLFSHMSVGEFFRYISYIFMDESHGVYSMAEKWGNYFEQLLEQGTDYAFCLLLSAGIVLISIFLCRAGVLMKGRSTEKTGDGAEGRRSRRNRSAAVGILVLSLTALLLQIRAVLGYLFEDQNQFYLQGRYMAIILPGLVLGIRYRKKMALWLYFCLLPGILSVAAVLFVTNMSVNVAYAKAFLAVVGSLAVLDQYGRQREENSFGKRILSAMNYTLAGTALATLLVCRLVLIRVSGCLPVTVRAPLKQMERGAEKGIYVLKETADIWNQNYRELEEYIERGELVLYIGAESLVYVCMEAAPATPSCQGTAVYNEMFVRYYEEHPERVPDVIVYDKTFGENPVYSLSWGFSMQNPVLFQWIEKNYSGAQRIETEHMLILKKESDKGTIEKNSQETTARKQ